MADKEMDFLAEIVAEGTALDPAFPAMVAAAEQQRAMERQAALRHARLNLTDVIPATKRLDAERLLPRSQRHERYAAGHAGRRKG